jgi:N-glycosidase YbiA
MAMIKEFQGEHRFLSNFWPAAVELDGVEYPSVEHAYQAAKTLDADHREKIAALPTPGAAKREGKKAVIREDWDDVKIPTMLSLLRQKFQIPSLKRKLLDTGSQEIQEGNTWGDQFWGVCRGTGQNNLGKLLELVRAESQSKEAE